MRPRGRSNLPDALDEWRFARLAKRLRFAINYNAADVGRQGFVRAVSFHPRSEAGPVRDAITGRVAA